VATSYLSTPISFIADSVGSVIRPNDLQHTSVNMIPVRQDKCLGRPKVLPVPDEQDFDAA